MNDTYITFSGWVGSDVDLTRTPNGTPVATFRVGSTPRRLSNGSWVDGPTSWFTVKAWRTLAENLGRCLHKGEAVVVHGRLEADVWDRPDGTSSTKYVVTASTVGHDLAKGTATFEKSPRKEDPRAQDEAATKELIHNGYEEAGPELDSFGEPKPGWEPAKPALTPGGVFAA